MTYVLFYFLYFLSMKKREEKDGRFKFSANLLMQKQMDG